MLKLYVIIRTDLDITKQVRFTIHMRVSFTRCKSITLKIELLFYVDINYTEFEGWKGLLLLFFFSLDEKKRRGRI